MLKIKFSHNYPKLLDRPFSGIVGPTKEAKLLEVLCVKLEDLSSELLKYDTDNGKYELPKSGYYLILIFQKNNFDIFTTIRKRTLGKELYYRSHIGNIFSIVVEKNK